MRTCSVESCERVHFAHSFCDRCYRRWKKKNDPAYMNLCRKNWEKYRKNNLETCRESRIKSGKKWRKNNLETAKKSDRIRAKKYREENRKKINERNRNNYIRKEKQRKREQVRKALKLGATIGIISETKELLKKQDYICSNPFCNQDLRELESKKVHLEHNIPLIRGGPHSEENISMMCQFCNYSKGIKTMEEFIEWQSNN